MATRPLITKWRQAERILIFSAVRWYLRNSLQLRSAIKPTSPGAWTKPRSSSEGWCYVYRAIDSVGVTIDSPIGRTCT